MMRLHKARLHTSLLLLHALTPLQQTFCPWAGPQQNYADEDDSQHKCCLEMWHRVLAMAALPGSCVTRDAFTMSAACWHLTAVDC